MEFALEPSLKRQRDAQARKAYSKFLELAPNSKTSPEAKKKLEALPRTP
jgi:hypothetical protein